MRDPKRIKIILAELEKYWIKHPELRLGQIVHNMICHEGGCVDTFYAEDSLIYHFLQIANIKESGKCFEEFFAEINEG